MISSKDLVKERILIVGSNGMLGQRLAELYNTLNNEIELLCCSVEEESFVENIEYHKVDITNKAEVKKLIYDYYPDYIINAAGYTNVDGCETERELSWKVNVHGVENLAQYSRSVDSKLIHISTDYIFDGINGPYTETAPANPVSYYGRTKLASENALRISGSKYAILRTNILYGMGKHGKPGFVKWIVDSLNEKKQIKIVTDQYNNPNYVDDLVQAIRGIIEFNKEGIYNVGGPEIISRYDFTLRIAEFFGLDKNLITPVTTAEFNFLARRPLKSGLIILKAQTEIGYKPHTIEETFSLMKKELTL